MNIVVVCVQEVEISTYFGFILLASQDVVITVVIYNRA